MRSRHLPWDGPEIAQPWKFHSLAVAVSRRIHGFGVGLGAADAFGCSTAWESLAPATAAGVPALPDTGVVPAGLSSCFSPAVSFSFSLFSSAAFVSAGASGFAG